LIKILTYAKNQKHEENKQLKSCKTEEIFQTQTTGSSAFQSIDGISSNGKLKLKTDM
jgi:hypothetical protein